MADDYRKRQEDRLLDTREKSQVEPVPKDIKFFEWVEKLFDGPGEFPERIDTFAVTGKNYERLGPRIKQILFPPKQPKPTREALVSMANELLYLMQRDCDIQKKSVVYGVFASHFSRETDYYERWLQRMYSTPVHRTEGLRTNDDDSEESMDQRFSGQVLGHHERLFALYGAGFEGLLDRMDRVLERQDTRIVAQDERIGKLSEMLERALSLEEERREKREWNQTKRDTVQKVVDMGLQLAPALINQFANKPMLEATSPEVLTIRGFLRGLSESQADVIFGKESGAPGILNLEQSKILIGVAQGHLPPDALDQLLPGSPLEIRQDQVMEMIGRAGITPDSLAPLHLIMQARVKRRQQVS